MVGVSLAILLTLAIPFASLRMGQPGPSVLPKGEQPRVAAEVLAKEFGAGVTGPVEILVDTPGGLGSVSNLQRIDALTRAKQRERRFFADL